MNRKQRADPRSFCGVGERAKTDRAILYGSYAAERERRDSDIDVAIISKIFGKDRVEEGMALYRIAGKVDTRLEPVPISVEAYENDTWLPLIYEIKTKGLELISQPGHATAEELDPQITQINTD